MTTWLIRMHDNCAYIWRRKYLFNFIAIPWKYHGGTWVVLTPDVHKDTCSAAVELILSQDGPHSITLDFEQDCP